VEVLFIEPLEMAFGGNDVALPVDAPCANARESERDNMARINDIRAIAKSSLVVFDETLAADEPM
jgi:hypothetical protein